MVTVRLLCDKSTIDTCKENVSKKNKIDDIFLYNLSKIKKEKDANEYKTILINYGKYNPPGGISEKKRISTKTYINQEITAQQIFNSFFINNNHIIHLIGEPQQGKTGVVNRFLELLINNHVLTKIIKDNIFILTGDNNIQWKIQTSERIPDILKDNLYIGNIHNINKLKKILSNVNSNLMFIIDESHVASRNSNMLIKLLSVYFLNDNNNIKKNNIRYLTLSATDPRHWLLIKRINTGFQVDEAKYFLLKKDDQYLSLEKLLNMGIILDINLIYKNNNYDFETIKKNIFKKYKNAKYHLIRFSIRNYNEQVNNIKNFFKDEIINVIEWNSNTKKDEDINNLLITSPKIHTLIIIKEMFRTSKTLIKDNIGIMIERFINKVQDDTIVQSFAGRCCGYDYNENIKVYTCLDSINRYVSLLKNISEMEQYNFKSKTLKMERGLLCAKKEYEYYTNIPKKNYINKSSTILWRINKNISIYNKLKNYDQEFTTKLNIKNKDIKIGDLILCLGNKNIGFLGIWKVIKEPYFSESLELDVYYDKYKDEIQKKNWRIRCKLVKNFEKPIIINNNEIYERLCKIRQPTYLEKEFINVLNKELNITIQYL